MNISTSYDFSSGHGRMWELDHKESWAWKNWCFWTVVLEKTLQSSLDCKEIKWVNPKETSPEYSLEGLMMKLKLHYIGHLMQKIDSLKETLMLWKIAIRRRGWQRMRQLDGIHQLNGYEFEQALGVGDGQGSLTCCSPWGHKELDTTEQLNWTENIIFKIYIYT